MKVADWRTFVGVGLVVTAVFFGTVLSYEHWSSDGWYEQSIDDVSRSSFSVATALDPSGRMHAVYHADEVDYNAIKHAVRSDGRWEISTVAQSSDYISDLEMTIGEDSVVRVSWWDSSKVHYATNAGGDFDVVSAEMDEPHAVAMTIDPSGNAHALVTTQHFVDSYPSYAVYHHEYWAITSGEWVLVRTYSAPEQTGTSALRSCWSTDRTTHARSYGSSTISPVRHTTASRVRSWGIPLLRSTDCSPTVTKRHSWIRSMIPRG